MIGWADTSDCLRKRINFIDQTEFRKSFETLTQPLLLNTDLMTPCRRFSLKGQIYPIQSMAIAPVFVDGDIVGSLNQVNMEKARLEMETGELSISLSHGLASTADAGLIQPEELLKFADKQLYAAKAEKRGRALLASGG
mgnify:CR=1 FL=1